MSYKSYAHAGQFGTYYIDLPIKTEINEDLRAASNFAEQMKLSQQYREKWANSYLSALNEKSNIERQNRDDNFEFLQNNFKSIYEGEQREFEGRLAELQREQAEAGPGFWDDLLPTLIKLAPKIAGMVAAGQAAHLEGQMQATTEVLNAHPDVSAAQLSANQNLMQSGYLTPTEQAKIVQGLKDNHMPGATFGQVQDVLHLTGEAQLHSQITAFRNTWGLVQQDIRSNTMPGSGTPLDPLHPQYRGAVGQNQWLRDTRSYIQKTVNSSLGSSQISDNVRYGLIQKKVNSLENSLINKTNNVWEQKAEGENNQHYIQQAELAFGIGTKEALTYYDGLIERELQVKNPDGTPISQQKARYNATVRLGEYLKNSTVTADQVTQFIGGVDSRKEILGHRQRGGPVDQQLDKIKVMLQKRDNDVQRVHTQNELNNQKKVVKDFKAQLNSIENPIKRQDLLNKTRSEDWSHNPEMDRFLKGAVSHPAVSQKINNPTFEQRTGITKARVEEAALNAAQKLIPTTPGNNKLGSTAWKELGSSKIVKDQVTAHIMARYDYYVKKYANDYPAGSEALLQQAAHDSVLDLKNAGALPIRNAPGDKDYNPTDITEFDFIIGNKGVQHDTNEYIRLTQENPESFFELTSTDRVQLNSYADIQQLAKQNLGPMYEGGDLYTPAALEDRVQLHNMPAVIARKKAFDLKGTPITLDQSADQLLELIGRDKAITKPFTMKDAESNSQILNRIYNQSLTTTNHGYAAGVDGKTNGGKWQPAPYVRSSLGLSNMSYIPGTSSNRTEWGSLPKQFWPFATKYYNAAERMGAPFPELVLAQAIHETGGGVAPHSVYMASGKTNPFGQTGEGTAGSFPDDRVPGRVWARYNNPDEAVAKHIEMWQSPYQHYPGVQPGDTPISYLKSIIQQYAPAGEGENSGYVAAVEKYLRQMGFDPHRPYQPKPDPTFGTNIPSGKNLPKGSFAPTSTRWPI